MGESRFVAFIIMDPKFIYMPRAVSIDHYAYQHSDTNAKER